MTKGSSFAGGKGRIFAYFQNPHTIKKRWISSSTSTALAATPTPCPALGAAGEDHDGKGLHYKKDGCPDVHFTWKTRQADYRSDSERAAISPNRNRRSTTKSRKKRRWPKKIPCKPSSRPRRYGNTTGLRSSHPNDMVLYQMGDFFELYGEDAKTAAAELGFNLYNPRYPRRWPCGTVPLSGKPAGTGCGTAAGSA